MTLAFSDYNILDTTAFNVNTSADTSGAFYMPTGLVVVTSLVCRLICVSLQSLKGKQVSNKLQHSPKSYILHLIRLHFLSATKQIVKHTLNIMNHYFAPSVN